MKNKGISLIVLIITIVVIVILATAIIVNLAQTNIINNANKAVEKNNKAQIKEQLILSIQDLQVKKLGKATLDDITQQWLEEIFPGFEVSIVEDASIDGKKVNISKDSTIITYIIDEKLNISELTSSSGLTYVIKSKNGDSIEILLTIVSSDVGLSKITLPDGQIIECNGEKEKQISYTVEYGKSSAVTITTMDGLEKEEKILINEYYYNVTKNLSEGISIDNDITKVEYNKPYTATIALEEGYTLKTLTVTMGEANIDVDQATGVINIDKVTGDIEIIAVAETYIAQFEDCMVEYWPLTEDLSNKVTTSSTGDLVLYRTNLPTSFSEENGAEFSSTVLKTADNYTFPEEFCLILKVKPMEQNTSKHFRFIWSKSTSSDGGYGSHNAFNSMTTGTTSQILYVRNGIFTDSTQEITSGTLEIGSWSTIIYQYDGTNLNAYLNGVCITEGEYAKTGFKNITSPLYIGGTYFTGATYGGLYWGYTNGYFKDVAIFNKAFTADQIEELNNIW